MLKKSQKLINLDNIKDTIKLGKELSKLVNFCNIFCIKGQLGTGKTTLARGFISNLTGIKNVLSPTFPMLLTYEKGKHYVCHYDLYRLKKHDDVWNINIENSLNSAMVIIEWPEIVENILPENRITITLRDKDNNSRTATIEGNEKFLDLI